MIGESGYSINQWLAAATRPPHLACTLIYNGSTDLYRDAVYHAGDLLDGLLQLLDGRQRPRQRGHRHGPDATASGRHPRPTCLAWC